MNVVLVVLLAGLYLVVVVEALAICVLYHRNTELLKMAMQGGGNSNNLIGLLPPQFKALEIRSKTVLESKDLLSEATIILFVSSNCFVCRELVNDLSARNAMTDDFQGYKLIVYCAGSSRGCERFLGEIDTNILALVGHEEDVADLFSVRSPPMLVEFEPSGRIVSIAYPLTIEDLLSSLVQSAKWETASAV